MYYFSRTTNSGYLYCPKFDKVDHGDLLPCANCEYFRGALQGRGRECEIGEDTQTVDIEDPYSYMDSKKVLSEVGE